MGSRMTQKLSQFLVYDAAKVASKPGGVCQRLHLKSCSRKEHSSQKDLLWCCTTFEHSKRVSQTPQRRTSFPIRWRYVRFLSTWNGQLGFGAIPFMPAPSKRAFSMDPPPVFGIWMKDKHEALWLLWLLCPLWLLGHACNKELSQVSSDLAKARTNPTKVHLIGCFNRRKNWTMELGIEILEPKW